MHNHGSTCPHAHAAELSGFIEGNHADAGARWQGCPRLAVVHHGIVCAPEFCHAHRLTPMTSGKRAKRCCRNTIAHPVSVRTLKCSSPFLLCQMIRNQPHLARAHSCIVWSLHWTQLLIALAGSKAIQFDPRMRPPCRSERLYVHCAVDDA